MGTIKILPETTKNPISLVGRRAGICQGADIEDSDKNYKRGLNCIKSNHGRVLEFVNVESIIAGYSARVIREWYTHIGGAPTRLQESTRYIDYSDFKYIIPVSIKTDEQRQLYCTAMESIRKAVQVLENSGVPREDTALLLPMGMETSIVDKRNARNIMDMARHRLCNRAYWEYREMFNDYLNQLSDYSDEWKILISMVMKPKCEQLGYCTEIKSCGKRFIK